MQSSNVQVIDWIVPAIETQSSKIGNLCIEKYHYECYYHFGRKKSVWKDIYPENGSSLPSRLLNDVLLSTESAVGLAKVGQVYDVK